MVLPMIGLDYLNKLGKNTSGRLKKLLNPLLKDGIGDKMDKGNLWIVPGFTVLAFAILWTTKLSKLALAESTCKGASIYDFTGSQLDQDAQRHCQTAKRYYVGIHEAISYDQSWREAREVKNPEWILWFWAPIVFVMYVLTRYLWSLLMENQGINFNNIVNASQSVITDNDDVTEVDQVALTNRMPVIADNFRCAASSNAFAAFMVFEVTLVLAPLFLLLFILPLMIGGRYRTWGLDVARAWWEKKEWQGSELTPIFGPSSSTTDIPLIPRISYCDYHFVTLGNDHVLTYRCYLDSNWHERTALFTWIMLVFLTFINICNLIFWILWALKMRVRSKRQKWIVKKWLNSDDFPGEDKNNMKKFARSFRMGNLLLLYYIEAHTDRVVASAFAMELYKLWKQKRPQNDGVYAIDMENDDDKPQKGSGGLVFPLPNIGWSKEPKNIGFESLNLPSAPGNQYSEAPTVPLPNAVPTPLVAVSGLPSPSTPPSRSTPEMPDTPSTTATGYSSSSTQKMSDSETPPVTPRKSQFFAANICQAAPLNFDEPKEDEKQKEKKKPEKKKRKKDDTKEESRDKRSS